MIWKTLAVICIVCICSLLYILVIPHFASTRLLMRFFPEEIREAAGTHEDPSPGKRAFGIFLTVCMAAVYIGAICFLGMDAVRHGYGFWPLYGRFLLFLYGYKLFDILVQDQYLVITRQYFVSFYPETRHCRSWHDRSFNTKNQLIRLALFPFLAALMAGAFLWIGG